MSTSKDFFMMLREREISTNNFLPKKKEVVSEAIKFANEIIDKGEITPQEALAQLVRINDAVAEMVNIIKTKCGEKSEAYGVTVTYTNGYDKPNYTDDSTYAEIQKKLKAREELLKLALKQDEPIYDSDAAEVPKVSTTPTKGSYKITY